MTEPPGWGISVSRSGEFQLSVINVSLAVCRDLSGPVKLAWYRPEASLRTMPKRLRGIRPHLLWVTIRLARQCPTQRRLPGQI